MHDLSYQSYNKVLNKFKKLFKKIYLRNYLQDMYVNIIKKVKISSKMFVICTNN